MSNFPMYEAARAAFYQQVGEAFGAKLPELHEPGWELMSGGSLQQLTGLDRRTVNDAARRYYFTDPTAHHMIDLHSAYTFGRGVTLRTEHPDLNRWVQAFWASPHNRFSISRARQQWRMSRELQLDGEVFLMLFTSTLTGRVTVRRIPSSQIADIVRHPGDADMPRYFIRKYRDENGKIAVQQIPDYRLAELSPARFLDGNSAASTEVAMMHIIGNDYGGRGISALSASIPWLKAMKGFMEDRATLTMVLALFALKVTTKGNNAALQRVASQFGQYETNMRYGPTADPRENRQGSNILYKNQALDVEQFETNSNAGNAYQDMRMFRQQAGIGAGIFEHYLGDPSTGNLATATAMELPMLKLFEFGQAAWGDVFSELGEYVIRQGVRFNADVQRLGVAAVKTDRSGGYPLFVLSADDDETDLSVNAIFPPIIQRDIASWANALAQLANSEVAAGHKMLPPEEKVKTALRIFGFTGDVGELIEQMRKDGLLTVQQPPQPEPIAATETTEAAGEDASENEHYVKEADEARDVGDLLPAADSKKLTKPSYNDYQRQLKAWQDLPSLDDLAKELGFDSAKDLDNA